MLTASFRNQENFPAKHYMVLMYFQKMGLLSEWAYFMAWYGTTHLYSYIHT